MDFSVQKRVGTVSCFWGNKNAHQEILAYIITGRKNNDSFSLVIWSATATPVFTGLVRHMMKPLVDDQRACWSELSAAGRYKSRSACLAETTAFPPCFSNMLQSVLFFSPLLPLPAFTVCVWALYSKILSHFTHLDALSWSSSTRTHSHYITPFFYVMTAAALRLNLPSDFSPHPHCPAWEKQQTKTF